MSIATAPSVTTRSSQRIDTQRTTRKKRGRSIGVAVLTTALLVVVAFPLVWLFLGSLKTQQEFLDNPAFALPENFFNFENYTRALTEGGNLATYARNSVIAVVPSLFLTIFLGVCAGFALEVMVWKGRGTVLLMFLAGGIMVPGQLILLPLFTIYFRAGLTGSLWP